MLSNKSFYLSSGSPRRKEILENLGFSFSIRKINVDEAQKLGEDPFAYVKRTAIAKSLAGLEGLDDNAVSLGADTIIVFNHQIIGKPKNAQHAFEILSTLSGKEHEVATAVAVASNQKIYSDLVISKVKFRELTYDEIKRYCSTGEPLDKSGAYGIQGLGRSLVECFSGSFSNIVGLPEMETANLLAHFGIIPDKK